MYMYTVTILFKRAHKNVNTKQNIIARKMFALDHSRPYRPCWMFFDKTPDFY